MQVIPFSLEIARVQAWIHADLRKRGAVIGAHDLIIAAIAIHLGWRVLAPNTAEFQRVAGLTVIAA